MTIQDVISECVAALYSNDLVRSFLILKGGTALSISENIQKRLSTDIDFSVSGEIENPGMFFGEIANILKDHFFKLNYELFDYKYSVKPSNRSAKDPVFWGGYEVNFKLIPAKHGIEVIDQKRRNAVIPKGSISSNISLEISEHEFCGLIKKFPFHGSTVCAYDPALLILEKLRAICQQHPNYRYRKFGKNRARDFFDIYQLLSKHRSASFYSTLKDNIYEVFKAKETPIELARSIFSDDFLALQKDGFEEVRNTVSAVEGRIEDFDFYVEQLQLLVDRIVPQ